MILLHQWGTAHTTPQPTLALYQQLPPPVQLLQCIFASVKVGVKGLSI